MSVVLLVTSETDPDHRELIPVAAQQIFMSRWLPGCSELKLEWVPLFETGILVDRSNVSAIFDELSRLREWMMQQAGYDHETERIARLIDGVETASKRPDLEVFVG